VNRKLFIHVGPAKTGTTAIQEVLRSYEGEDLLYPRVGLWSDGAHHNLVSNFFGDYARPEVEKQDPTAMLTEIAQLAAGRSGNVLISSEGLAHRDVSSFASALLHHLRSAGEWELQVLYVCRDHFGRGASLYNQAVKDGVRRMAISPDEYLKRSAQIICYAPTLRRLRDSGLPVVAMNYHPSASFVPRFFAHIGISQWQELGNQSRNVSLSTKGLIALLAANRVAESADDRARYFSALCKLRNMWASSTDIFSPGAKVDANSTFAIDRSAVENEFGVSLPTPTNLEEPSQFQLAKSELEEIASLVRPLGDEGTAIIEVARAFVTP
jgi:hypothetical protein